MNTNEQSSVANRDRVEQLCRALGSVTPLQIAGKAGITRQNAHYHLSSLAALGRLRRHCRGLYSVADTKAPTSGERP